MNRDTEVVGMDTDVEGMDHMAPEVEGMMDTAPEVLRRGSIIPGEPAKNRDMSDDVSESFHLGEGFETRRSARDP